MRVFKSTYKDRKGITKKSKKWYIEFFDHLNVRRRLAVFKDKQATQEIARKVDKLKTLTLSGEPPNGEMAIWLESLPDPIRERLLKIGLLDSKRVAASKSLLDHLLDSRQFGGQGHLGFVPILAPFGRPRLPCFRPLVLALAFFFCLAALAASFSAAERTTCSTMSG